MSISSFLTMVGEMGTSIVRRAGVAGDLMGGMAATSKTIGATTEDFVDVFGNRGANDYTAGLRSSLEATNRNLDDTALKAHFQGSSPALDNASFNEMKMAREYFLKRQDASQYDSRASFEAVQRNIREGGDPNAGYSRAGETRAESALTRIFDTEATGMGNELKFLGASALLGGGANYMTGGEFGTGAGVGAIAATGIRGAGRIIQQNMPEIETVMMKRLMGEEAYGKLTPKDFVETKAAVPAEELLPKATYISSHLPEHQIKKGLPEYTIPGTPEVPGVPGTKGIYTLGDLIRSKGDAGYETTGSDLVTNFGHLSLNDLGFRAPKNASYKATTTQRKQSISEFVSQMPSKKREEFLNSTFSQNVKGKENNFAPYLNAGSSHLDNVRLPREFVTPGTHGIPRVEGTPKKTFKEIPGENINYPAVDPRAIEYPALIRPAQPAEGYYATNVRTQALNAIKGMSAEQVKEKGIGSSYIQKMLTDKDKGNMGRNMRLMTISGAALAGVPFTGRRNDHSSGFNKNRGNKI